METIGKVLKILCIILSTMCYGIYLYSDRKKDCYQAIKILILGSNMQNVTFHLE